jgi:hypothetical protein
MRDSTRRTVASVGGGAGQRVAAGSERGQDLAGRIRGPLADRGQRPGAGQHRAHRHGQHRAQRMPAAASPSRIGELGEVGEQAAALVADQRCGRDRMGAPPGWEMMSRQARRSGLVVGFDTA